MDLTDYYHLVSHEKRARRYLARKCLKNGRRICPRCSGKKLYRLANDRRRCARCKYTFHDFSGRWINRSQLSCVQWLSVIKLFELEVPTRSISDQLNINYKTIARAIEIIRRAISKHSKCSFNDCHNGSPITFGVLENNKQAQITTVPDISVMMIKDLPVRKFRKGSIIYTGRYNGYDGLIAHSARYETGYNGKQLYRDQSSFSEFQGFMNWAAEKFQNHRMVSKKHFPLFLKELEFRYNHPEETHFELTAQAICELVQNES